MSYETTKENVFLEFHSLILKATNSAKSTSSSEIGRPIYTYLVSARTQRRKLSMTSHFIPIIFRVLWRASAEEYRRVGNEKTLQRQIVILSA